MFLFDYIVNLSIFSLFVSTPLVIRSFMNLKPLKQQNLWVGLYAGSVSVILVLMSVKQQGYAYDIRYAPVILMFAYLGPVGGLITGFFALSVRLLSSGNWLPAIGGWVLIMLVFCFLHVAFSRRQLTPLRRSIAFSGAYMILYFATVVGFRILVNKPFFHLQYLLFVILGVILGSLLIESNERLRRIITDRNYMEKTLEARESQYRLIADHTSDLILLMDKTYAIRYFSPSHGSVLGYQSLALDDCTALFKIICTDDADKFKRTIARIFADKHSHSMEIRFRHKEGHLIAFDTLCKPVEGDDGAIEYIVMISRDISERKKAEGILLQSEKLAVIGELAAGVAHEIRNPLTTIKGFLQLYKAENPSIKYSDLLIDELERIEMITCELLTMAKPQAVMQVRTDVKDLIEHTLEFLTPQTLLHNIEFRRDYAGTAFPMTCVKDQMKQVFLNVLKNAIESMPGGGEIRIGLHRESDHACLISIRDQGCGIPDELIDRLGQPFYSLKEKGTGLGLMISHKIIKQYHGSIAYESKLNEGTLVEIRLPLAD
ncbi:ATP-binding protein [Paenibacillus glycinis]|uniref:histidine kinase n=1 Tax=Paenibacillus glycinis TaxID=2697035 RepID=A0ABW9XXE1_9BACL|nr:PAS domain-containing sensor histidine kinase [Paenibacillus glycinis]NBD27398.1 PAS domain S-box protein [Paenibacillus glycinis]